MSFTRFQLLPLDATTPRSRRPMSKRGCALIVTALVGLLAATLTGRAATNDPAAVFAALMRAGRTVCPNAPAPTCLNHLWTRADRDGNEVLQLSEAQDLRRAARAWVEQPDNDARETERNLVWVGLLILKHAELANVFASLDTDADGVLARGEAFADIRLDQRPMPELLEDPSAVDWQRFAGRFGKVSFLITDLLPPTYRR